MKKKLQLKAVQLKAETIRVLSSALLDRVAGGQTSYPPICGWPDPPVVVETEPWTFLYSVRAVHARHLSGVLSAHRRGLCGLHSSP